MKKINYLKRGDCVALVAPARAVTPAETEPFVRTMEEEGYRVLAAPHLYGRCCQFSGTDAERAEDFQWALDHPEVKAVFCARGGYGGMRIVDALDFTLFAQHPKWICGYSDTTVFHSHLHALGYPTLHATMPINVTPENRDSLSMRSLLAALRGEPNRCLFPSHPLNREGVAEAEICGGNLSMLYALQGSSSALHTEGKVLFLEDLDEYLYHIDRMMLNLKRSGMLEGLAGLVVGGLSDMHDNAVPFGKTAEEIVLSHVASYGYPVCFGFPAGHADPSNNHALLLGKRIRLQVGRSETSLVWVEEPVRDKNSIKP